MTIVDARTHIGRSRNSPSKISSEDLIAYMDRYEIDAAIVQPLPSAADVNYEAEHDLVTDLATRYPKRIFGLTCIPPQLGWDRYFEETERYINEHGFVGLKYHPLFHGGSLLSPWAEMVYEAGQELGMPVVVHTGPGANWSLPSYMIPVAKKYPDTTFILAHSGGWIYAEDAIVAAEECENLILDTSWQYPITVSRFVRAVGAERIVMASDFPENLPMQRTLWDSLDITEEERRAGLGQVTIEIFGLQDRL